MSSPAATTPKTGPAPGSDAVVEPSPFRNPRFTVFAAGNAINNVGEAMYATALPLLAYRLTGSLAVMTLLAAAVPVGMLLAPSLGWVADRWGPRALVVPGLLLQALAALVMNLVLHAGTPTPGSLFVCALLVAIGGAAYRTGWMTGVPGMFPDCPVRARGTLNSLFFAATLAGPLVFSLCLPFLGYEGLLWLNLATFFAPVAVWAMGVHPPRVRPGEPGAGRNWKLSEGWKAIVADRRVLDMLIVQVVLAVTCGAGFEALVVYSLGHTWSLSDRAVSAVITVMNACMLAGNLLVAQRKRIRPWITLTLGMTACGLSLLLLAVPWRPVFLAAVALGALGEGAVLSTVVMMRVKYLPGPVLGRASGLMWLVTGGAALLSPAVTPALTEAVGARGTFLVLGLGACSALWYLRRGRADWLRPSAPVASESNA
ncbi:MFS transporter [Streptomyces roseus]|uniref:MFS transporter n=1 Tax=Streptomyces roseus TaxID=66430 RepID=UPI0036BAB7C2